MKEYKRTLGTHTVMFLSGQADGWYFKVHTYNAKMKAILDKIHGLKPYNKGYLPRGKTVKKKREILWMYRFKIDTKFSKGILTKVSDLLKDGVAPKLKNVIAYTCKVDSIPVEPI